MKRAFVLSEAPVLMVYPSRPERSGLFALGGYDGYAAHAAGPDATNSLAHQSPCFPFPSGPA